MQLSRSLLIVVAAFGLAACHSKKKTVPEALPAVAVQMVVVANEARPSTEEVVGIVRAKLHVRGKWRAG